MNFESLSHIGVVDDALKHWYVQANGGLSEWGEWQSSGTYSLSTVIFRGRGDYHNSNVVEIVGLIGCGRRYASFAIKYFGFEKRLFRFKCRSIAHAIRKANFRLRGRIDRLASHAIKALYRLKRDWRCVYTPEGEWIAADYERDWFLGNGRRGYRQRELIVVSPDGSGWKYEFSFGCIVGRGMKPSAQFPYRISV